MLIPKVKNASVRSQSTYRVQKTIQTHFGGNHENSLIDGYTESLLADVSDLSDETYSVPPVNAWSKPLAIVATKEATTTTSEQASTITNTNTNTNTATDITALTTMVEQLRSDMKEQMKVQQETIESIIDNAINTKLAAIDQRYQNILEKINKRWEDALTKQLEKAERDIDTTVDKVIARRDEVHAKTTRSEPGSGNTRPHKFPRPPPRALDSIKQRLMSEFTTVESPKLARNDND